MVRVIKRTIVTQDPEVAAEARAKGWEVETEVTPIVGGPFHILTGANLIKKKRAP